LLQGPKTEEQRRTGDISAGEIGENVKNGNSNYKLKSQLADGIDSSFFEQQSYIGWKCPFVSGQPERNEVAKGLQ